MIRVRRATSADLPRMIQIAARSVTAAQWSQHQFEQIFSRDRLVLVIEEAAHILGFIAGRGAAGQWEIENIAVTGAVRRCGLGSRLLREFLRHARGNGGKEVFLEVRESNRAARVLYGKWAFIEAGRRMGYYQDPPEDALILKFNFPQES